MLKRNKEDNTCHNEDNNFERIEETLKYMWELISTMSDDIFEIKKKLGLEGELHKGRRSDLGISNLIKIAIKQHPMLHPCSIFDEVSFHIAFSDGVDTRIYSKFKLPDGGTDVFEDEAKSKLFDDWVNKNKEYWLRQIKMYMAEIYGWKLFDSLKESSVKVPENDNSSKICDLMLASPEFKKFKYKIDTQEIVYFGAMSLAEKEQCFKLSTNEVDKKYIEELYKKSQTAKDLY
jgi:hypothetical protein